MDELTLKHLRASLAALRPSISAKTTWATNSHYNVGLSLNEIRRSLLEAVGDSERAVLESTIPALDVKVPKGGRGEVWTVGAGEANRLYAQLEGILASAGPSDVPQPALRVEGGNGSSSIDVFVSHSSDDVAIVTRLITLVRSALNLRAERI